MDQEKALPLYFKVAETIKFRILNNTYSPGERIPSAKELAEEFGVSNITIRKAVEHLSNEGFVNPKQGYGTLVAELNQEVVEIRITGNFREWLDSASEKTVGFCAEVLELVETEPHEKIRSIMGLSQDEKVARLKRIRRYNGKIVSYFENYFPAEYLPSIDTSVLTGTSFIETFQTSTKMSLSHMDQWVKAGIADFSMAGRLEVPFGSPLFCVENIYHAKEGGPVIVSLMFYRGDSYVYKATIPLDG